VSERQLINSIRWDEPPPPPDVVYAPILSPEPGGSEHGLIVCPEFVGVKTHWIEKRTTGCIGRPNGCEGCRDGKPTRWKGYMGVYRICDGRLWLAELTPRAFEDIAAIVAADVVRLLGWHLTLRRTGTHRQGMVRAALRPPTPEERAIKLPRPFDLKRSLLLVWERLRRGDGGPEQPEEGEEVPT
jgi:hypothetical protein